VCLITAFRASRGWNASEVLLYTSSFDSCGEDQEATDSLLPNCYKVISIRCILGYLYVLYVCDCGLACCDNFVYAMLIVFLVLLCFK
jgi:hypothetical protein